MNPKPTVGRVVHYRLIDEPKDHEIAAATVVKVSPLDSEVVDLHVMHSKYKVPDTGPIVQGGCFTAYNVKPGDGAGQWSWPPRV